MAAAAVVLSAPELRKFYLDQQEKISSPWEELASTVSLVVGLVVTLFAYMRLTPASSILGCGAAILFGSASTRASSALGQILISKCVNHDAQQAADAVIMPGFYTYANQKPSQLGTAAEVVAAFHEWQSLRRMI